MHDGGTFSTWRDDAVARYREIRHVQASKLLPCRQLLGRNGFADVEGSLINPDEIDQPFGNDTAHVEKMLNYVYVAHQLQPEWMLEIGFNWGFSASLLMEACEAPLDSIDIAEHWYAKSCAAAMQEIYGSRFTAIWGDSRAVMPQRKAAHQYDLIVIDGGHAFRNVEADIIHCDRALNPGGVLIVDDTDVPSVRAGVLATLAGNPRFIQLTPENFGLFPCVRRSPYHDQLIFMKRSA